ncbi:MAG: hypothetical protein JWP13_932 [Candidatus Saccharibacteria bacterium]|nr:hypothetical protein [Candidatus Saccharibacteria bacterium]
MNFSKIKSLFLRLLIACLVAASLLAVVTVLVGSFTEVSSKALITILLIAVHSLVSISFITNHEKQDTFSNLAVFTNVTFGIIVLSFITSVLGVWGLLSGELVGKLYALFVVLLFACLHGEVLAKTLGKQVTIDKVVYANFVFMTIVVLMLLPVIFSGFSESLGSFYYRLLAAVGIIDATLSLVAVILHTLYVQKHPQISDPVFSLQQLPYQQNGENVPVMVQQPKRHTNIFVVILIGFLVLQVIGSVLVAVIGAISKN